MKKSLNGIITILMTIIIILNTFSISFASVSDLISGAQSESGPVPPKTTPSDTPHVDIPSSTPTLIQKHGDVTIQEPYYDGITGNAYEDLGIKVSEGQGEDSKGINKKAIKYIRVDLFNESDDIINGTPVDTTYTSGSGYYKFENVSPGKYKVKFTYGLIDSSKIDDDMYNNLACTSSNINALKEMIKYNGQDYLVSSVGGSGGISYVAQTYAIDQIIKRSGAGCAQIFLAIDCSYSMRNSKVTINGEEKTMLRAQIDAAKEMIQSLLDGKKNIYIGIVAFSGNAYRAASLTDKVDSLYEALEKIDTKGWYAPNTDVNLAVEKAYSSFSNNGENSNRYIMLLTDGIPTKYGMIQVYNGEDESDTYEKLVKISESTRDSIKDYVENKGVNIYGVCISNDNETEDEFVTNIFSETCSEFYLEKDIKSILYKINGNFKKYVIESIKANEIPYEEYGEDTYSLSGKEYEARRKELDEYYAELNYSNTEYFKAIDMNVNNSNWKEFKEKAKKISDNAYMIAVTETYTMTPKGQDYDIVKTDYYEEDDGSGNLEKVAYEYTEHHVFIETKYEHQDLVLNNRGYFNIVPTITASGLRVTASNLQVLKNVKMEDKLIPLMAELDPTLIYGSRVDLEYTLKVKNNSTIPCKSLSMIVYLPKGFSYNNKTSYVTGNINNPKYKIRGITTQELKSAGLVSGDFNKEDLLVLESTDGFGIVPGGETEMKFVISKLISTDIDDSTYSATTEVLKYGNNSGRRSQMQLLGTSADKYVGVYPGNLNPDETDIATSTNEAKVIPPTGTKENIVYVYLTIVVLIIALLNVSRLKNKVKMNGR